MQKRVLNKKKLKWKLQAQIAFVCDVASIVFYIYMYVCVCVCVCVIMFLNCL